MSELALWRAIEQTQSRLTRLESQEPYHPLFEAYVTASAANATGDGTVVQVSAYTEVADPGGDFNAATGVFTAPRTGKYQLSGIAYFANVGAGHTTGKVYIVTTKRTAYLWFGNPATGAAADTTLIVGGSLLLDMDATDTATLNVAVLNSTKTVSLGQTYTFFTGILLT